MIDASTDVRHNHLLAAVPHDHWPLWLPSLEYVEMPLGQVLYEAGSTWSHVYFPTTAIVSLLYVMQNGESARSLWSATKDSPACPLLWALSPPPAGRSCKVHAAAFD